ncbi:MAG: 30S ribosomal protein S5 [Candidatus Magasanikbacteria bacterium]|nr:30S ribosomal protein S5 [Candidatus Magasanikbacteria bacterium]
MQKERPEFDQYIADLARVTRVTKGGKQLSFRACVLIGDRKGRVGYGTQKGKDVQIAVEKAVSQARKQIIVVPIIHDTIPHRVESKFKAAKVMLKPAPKGSGIIAGSVVRTVLEFAGVPNASGKILGKSNNKIANIKATFAALQSFKPSAIRKMQAWTKQGKEKTDGKLNDEKKDKTTDTRVSELPGGDVAMENPKKLKSKKATKQSEQKNV